MAAEAEAAREARAKVECQCGGWLSPSRPLPGDRGRGGTESLEISGGGEQSDVRDWSSSAVEIPAGIIVMIAPPGNYIAVGDDLSVE